jgi:formylglycine-generating enzyme required for sulfatase activity
MSRIFLSHSSKDNYEAEALRSWLSSEGWEEVFLDLDPQRGIAAGERWERALHAAAVRCEAVVFLVSSNWLASGWCRKEYELARGLNKPLLAVIITLDLKIADLPPEFTGVWQVIDLAGGQDLQLFPTKLPGSYEERHIAFSISGLVRLQRGLVKAGLDPKFFAWPPDGDPKRVPYRGLKSLEAEDAGVFFGRAGPIVEATDRLRGLAAAAAPRLFVLLGASGAGKSSFLRAGLLPRLARDDEHFLPLQPIRPASAALTGETGLVSALAVAFPKKGQAELRSAVLKGALEVKPLLVQLIEERPGGSGEAARRPTVLFAIDQAEELFRAEGSEEAEKLLKLVGKLSASTDLSVIVVFAIRSDSYDALERAKPLEGLRQAAMPLLPMPRGAFKEVIEGPAQRVVQAGGKLTITPQLTDELLSDIEAGGADALPLLAFTLEQLYLDYGRAGAMKLADYETFGGLKGAIDAAVLRAFERANSDARIPKDRDARITLLRRGLIPWLASVDPGTMSPRRNIARRSDIPTEAAPLIDLLVEERLLSSDTRTECNQEDEKTRVVTIEPTHEALLRQWSLLRGWLAEDLDLLVALEGTKRAAQDWNAHTRSSAWLAHHGQRLAAAVNLNERPDIEARLDAIDHAYIAACKHREAAELRRSRIVQGVIYTLLLGIILGLIGWINQAAIRKQANWYFVMRPYMNDHVRPFVLFPEAERALKPFEPFHECDATTTCPEMVIVPASGAQYQMGSPTTEALRKNNEGPQHPVTIPRAFAVSKFDVTFDDWDACVKVGGCPSYSDSGMGRGRRPVIHVTWEDAHVYVDWLAAMTGQPYRLLSEAEWEYAARAGTTTAYFWGDDVGKNHADCIGCKSAWDGKGTSPVGTFPANAFGLFDMAGNVWEWVEDCYHADYSGEAPADGKPWTTGGDCNGRVARGGGWTSGVEYIRSAARLRITFDDRNGDVGFRVARTLSR